MNLWISLVQVDKCLQNVYVAVGFIDTAIATNNARRSV